MASQLKKSRRRKASALTQLRFGSTVRENDFVIPVHLLVMSPAMRPAKSSAALKTRTSATRVGAMIDENAHTEQV
jgi:hypothetical protein